LVCVFTVVNNAFGALECTEHTCYDAIVIEKNLPSHGIDSLDFVNVLRNVGALTPIILLYEEGTDVGDISKYCCALRKPFTANSLCEAILFAKNFTSERFEECGSENSYYPVNSEDYVGSISEPFPSNNISQDILMACLDDDDADD